ncbi:hypothetical protein Tco_1299875, partial [Tanacetum coccineum]
SATPTPKWELLEYGSWFRIILYKWLEENVVAQLLTDEEIIESVIGINKDDIDEEDDENPFRCVLVANLLPGLLNPNIYGCAKDRSSGEDGETNVIVSFDLESEKFGKSLGVLADDYDDQGYDDEVTVCGVWMMDFVTKSFTKMFTIKQPKGKWAYLGLYGVLGFRKNGEVIIEVMEDGMT